MGDSSTLERENERTSAILSSPNRRSSVYGAPVRRVRTFRLWTIDYYIIRSFLSSYFVCGLSFTGLYMAVEAFTKIHRFIPGGSLSPLDVASQFLINLAQYHIAMVPTIYVNYMGPILTLSAAMFSLTLMNRGNEFAAVKAAGISIYRVTVPVFILAAGFTALTVYLQERVIPEIREPIRRALAVSRSGALRPKPFYDPVNNLHIEVKSYAPDLKVAESVTIKKWNLGTNTNISDTNIVIDAKKMVWMPASSSTTRNERGRWQLRDGSIQRWKAKWRGELIYSKKDKKFYQLRETFSEHEIETILLPIDLETSDQDISYLSWRELKTQFERQPYHRHLRARLHHHFAFPLSHVVLLLLGIPFVLNYGTRSYFLSLVVSFFLCAGYFLVSSMALSLASDPGETYLSPIIASWLPNILFGSLGLTIFTNMRS